MTRCSLFKRGEATWRKRCLASLWLMLLAAFVAALPGGVSTASAAGRTDGPPLVVTTLPPVQGLLATLMAGSGQSPRLLFEGELDPHHLALRPSQLRLLARADLVFLVSPALEAPLARLQRSGTVKGRILALADAPGVTLLPRRQLDPPGLKPRRRPSSRTRDWHIWGDPANVIAMARWAARQLADADPPRAALYAGNAARLERRLKALGNALQQRLAPLRSRAYILAHDATQYFERRFGLSPLAVIQPDHEAPPGPRRLAALQRLARQHKGLCILAPKGEAMRWAKRLAEAGGGTVGVIDVLGRDILKTGLQDFWPRYFTALTTAYADCLGKAPVRSRP